MIAVASTFSHLFDRLRTAMRLGGRVLFEDDAAAAAADHHRDATRWCAMSDDACGA